MNPSHTPFFVSLDKPADKTLTRFIRSGWRNVCALAALGLAAQTSWAQAIEPAVTPSLNRAAQQSTAKQWGAGAVEVFLKAELLAQDGEDEQAARLLLPMAIYLNQSELFERVVAWAGRAKQAPLMVMAARAWEQSDPTSDKAKDILQYFLVVQRLENLNGLRAAGKPDEARQTLLLAYDARRRINTAQLALMLAEQLDDDYHPKQALVMFAQTQTLATSESERVWANAKRLSILAKQGDNASLAALLALQKTATRAVAGQITTLSIAVLRDLNQAEQALVLAKTLPADEAAYESALCYEALGQTVQAETLLRDALKKTPKAAHLLNALGYGLVDRNANPASLAEGTDLLKTAQQQSPDSAAIMDSLGWAYFRLADYAAARPLLQKAYDLRRDPEVAAHLGELLHTTGKTDAARELWMQGLALDPKHKILNDTLKRLRVGLTPTAAQ